MNRELIDNLIVHLLAVSNYAKDIHYNCTGANFYGNHIFADRINDNLAEYIDQLKEICLLGHNLKTLPSKVYLSEAAQIIPDGADFGKIRAIMIDTLKIVEQIKDVSKGDENLLGAIAQDIQNNIGLINIMLGA